MVAKLKGETAEYRITNDETPKETTERDLTSSFEIPYSTFDID